MNKTLLAAALAVVAVAPFAAKADESNQLDNFFVAGNLGQSNYRIGGVSDKTDVFQNVRFGWRWNGIVGPEIGYAYLGRPKADVTALVGQDASMSVKPRALTIGVNAKYNVYENWFVTAHAGYLRSKTKFDLVSGGNGANYTTYNNGVYAGLGVGYDLTKNVSVGLNYDNYRINSGNSTSEQYVGVGRNRTNVAAYSASVEYRF